VTASDLSRRHGVAEKTLYRWKWKHAGMAVSEAKCLREQQDENARLNKRLARAELDKAELTELVEGCW